MRLPNRANQPNTMDKSRTDLEKLLADPTDSLLQLFPNQSLQSLRPEVQRAIMRRINPARLAPTKNRKLRTSGFVRSPGLQAIELKVAERTMRKLNELAPVLLVAEALNDVAEEQTRLDLIRALDLPEDTSYEEAVAAAFSDAFDEALESAALFVDEVVESIEDELISFSPSTPGCSLI